MTNNIGDLIYRLSPQETRLSPVVAVVVAVVLAVVITIAIDIAIAAVWARGSCARLGTLGLFLILILIPVKWQIGFELLRRSLFAFMIGMACNQWQRPHLRSAQGDVSERGESCYTRVGQGRGNGGQWEQLPPPQLGTLGGGGGATLPNFEQGGGFSQY